MLVDSRGRHVKGLPPKWGNWTWIIRNCMMLSSGGRRSQSCRGMEICMYGREIRGEGCVCVYTSYCCSFPFLWRCLCFYLLLYPFLPFDNRLVQKNNKIGITKAKNSKLNSTCASPANSLKTSNLLSACPLSPHPLGSSTCRGTVLLLHTRD